MTSGMEGVCARLRQAIEVRMSLAREASRSNFLSDNLSTADGEHWRWECSNCDALIDITPVTILDEFLECPSCASVSVALRSVEEYTHENKYPDGWNSTLGHHVTHSAEEIRPADGAHIVANDPATILRHCARELSILDSYELQATLPVRSTEGMSDRELEEARALYYARETFKTVVLWLAEAYQVDGESHDEKAS